MLTVSTRLRLEIRRCKSQGARFSPFETLKGGVRTVVTNGPVVTASAVRRMVGSMTSIQATGRASSRAFASVGSTSPAGAGGVRCDDPGRRITATWGQDFGPSRLCVTFAVLAD